MRILTTIYPCAGWTFIKGRFSQLGLTVLAIGLVTCTTMGKAAMGADAEIVIPVRPDAVTHIYGATAAGMEGAAASLDHLPKAMVIRWVGRGSATWQVNVPEAGDYEVALCYAALASGAKLEIASGDNRITGVLRKTDGPYYPRKISEEGPLHTDFLRNFERVHFDGVLHLAAGVSEITVRITKPESGEVMDFRSMELTPVAAKAKIAAAAEAARQQRGSTDWLVEGKYGVMFHWTGSSQPRNGDIKVSYRENASGADTVPAFQKAYSEAVRDFDVDAFADMVEETGASWVIFTVNHSPPHCPAPIKSWEAAHPGWTTERDLLGDMADALGKKDIKLICYIASHIIMRGDNIPEEESVEIHAKVLAEMGERYGEKLAGYWFDGWDIIPQDFPSARISFKGFFDAAKTGNPDRIIGLNFWIFPDATPWQEFWAGEADEELKPTVSRYMKYAAGEGLQRHALFMLEDIWVHRQRNGEIPAPVFTEQALIDYVKNLTANDGVATINMGSYRDGTVSEKSLAVMRSLKRAMGK